ncbi:hypothetical protein [Bordetella bronchiseptica]|uniref:hypothetical protein n=1 Tax=Bordetella bronchiseptica TaxID=518 RepID=UPI00052810BB|nr:hypothetical protein [Bordetella bronchiseptica]
MRRRRREIGRFSVADAAGNRYTIIELAEEVEVTGLGSDQVEWGETMRALVTLDGTAVNKCSDEDYLIVSKNLKVKRV